MATTQYRPISLQLFGAPSASVGGGAVNLGRRARGVVAYLALSKPSRASRDRLAGLFWPDRDEAQSRASLRQCLLELRTALGDAVVADREWVTLDVAGCDGDLVALDAAVAGHDAGPLTAALTDIGAERLVDGLEFGEAFDDWLRGCRAALDTRVAATVGRLVELARDRGDLGGALALADAWLRRDPLDERIATLAIAIEVQCNAPGAARKRLREFEAALARDGYDPPGPQLRAALDAGPPAAPHSNTAVDLATGVEFKLPSKPSIALLPFADLGGGQDAFADGMVEEISTALSRFSGLFVIAGQSSLSYRASLKTAQQIARELGVRYLLEGSVRKATDRVRITVKLVDAARGDQIWAERFDGSLDDIFELQDRVAVAVATTIDSTVTDAEMIRAAARPTTSPDAYELNLCANAKLNEYTRDSIGEALVFAERAVALDPDYAWAVAVAGFCHAALWMNRWSDEPRETRNRALAHVERALRLAGDDQLALAVAAGALLNIGGDMELASQLIERALALNPAKSYTLFWAAWIDLLQARFARALERFELALRSNPRSVYRPFQLTGMGNCLYFLDRFDEAAIVQAETIRLVPDYPPAHTILVASLVRSGRHDAAAAAAARASEFGGPTGGLAYFTDPAQIADLRDAIANVTRPLAHA